MFNQFCKMSLLAFYLTACFHSITLESQETKSEYELQVMAQLVEIEQVGILKYKDNGYLYLDVSDEFISKAIPLMDTPGKLIPTRHFTNKNGIGAHITVIYENENIAYNDSEIMEVGQPYYFTVRELYSFGLNRDNAMSKLWMIDVDAPELSLIREKYGLTPLFKGHNFHITLGTEIAEDGDTENIEVDSAEAA